MNWLICASLLAAAAAGEVQPDAVAGQVETSQNRAGQASAPASAAHQTAPDAAAESPADDVIIVVDEPSTDASGPDEPGEPTSGDELIVIGEPTDQDSSSSQTTDWDSTQTRLTLSVGSRALVDTRFDPTREDVFEWWSDARLQLDHEQSDSLKAYAEVLARWGVISEAPRGETVWLGVNGTDGKWLGGVSLREAFVDWQLGDLQLKIGQQLFVWGNDELFAPADVINPADLRWDPIALLASPRDAKVPVLAADVAYWWGDTVLELVVMPFFAGNKLAVYGRDFAAGPPGSRLDEQVRTAVDIDPSIEDALQSAVAGTRVPEESPLGASVALRGTTRLWGWDFGATAYFGWDRAPRLWVDDDLQRLLANGQGIFTNPNAVVGDAEVRQAAVAVQQKLAVGQQLFSAEPARLWRFALEARGVVGDVVVRFDGGFSPLQTFYSEALDTFRRPAAIGAGGIEYTRGEQWYAALSAHATTVFGAPAEQRLIGIEGRAVEPQARSVAVLYGVHGSARYRWTAADLEASLTGIYNISPGDLMLSGEVVYTLSEPHTLGLGALSIHGPVGTLGDSYKRNDFAYLRYTAAW